MKDAAEILKLNYDEFARSIRFKFREIGGEVIASPFDKNECIVARDSVAKELYNRMFNWLVIRMNSSIMPEEFLKPGADTVALYKSYLHIGLLDIFGFEIFPKNSLEQLCINYTNEKLQQLYVSYVFKAENKEFIEEGLEDYLKGIQFEDNQAVLDFIDMSSKDFPGVFQILDDLCTINSNDEAFFTKVQKLHGKNPKAVFPRMGKEKFAIVHTAATVEYFVEGFRAKNKDELGNYIERALANSGFPEVVKIFKGPVEEKKEEDTKKPKGGAASKFLGAKFRSQMTELYEELLSCNCHFVRCIKPNPSKQKGLFVAKMTLEQIKYMGILDTIKIRRELFPVRRLFKTFYQKYDELHPTANKTRFEKHVEQGADFKAFTNE